MANNDTYIALDVVWPNIQSKVQDIANASASAAVAANNANMGTLMTQHLAKALPKTRDTSFTASPARAVTYQAIVHWNAAFKWGNHAEKNYWRPNELLGFDFKTTGTVTVGGLRLSKNGAEIKPYSGPLHDSHGVKIADVVDGLIVTVSQHSTEVSQARDS